MEQKIEKLFKNCWQNNKKSFYNRNIISNNQHIRKKIHCSKKFKIQGEIRKISENSYLNLNFSSFSHSKGNRWIK